MKKIFLGLALLHSMTVLADQSNLREEFIHSKKATFKDIQNIQPKTASDITYSRLDCPDKEMKLIKLSHNHLYDAGSVVSDFIIQPLTNELIGTSNTSSKTKVIRISERGTALIEFSRYRTRRDAREGVPSSVVFSGLTAVNYMECLL